MKSETHHEPGPSLLGLEALIPGGDTGYHHTTITDDNGNKVAEGYGNTSEESQRNASDNRRS